MRISRRCISSFQARVHGGTGCAPQQTGAVQVPLVSEAAIALTEPVVSTAARIWPARDAYGDALPPVDLGRRNSSHGVRRLHGSTKLAGEGRLWMMRCVDLDRRPVGRARSTVPPRR